jgi:heptosyltransferase-3
MNIVVIRTEALGDSLLTLPILVALRKKYHHPHITFVGHPAVMPLAKAWAIADEVYDCDKSLKKELYSAKGIRNTKWRTLLQKADLVITWNYIGGLDAKKTLELLRQNLRKATTGDVICESTVPLFEYENVSMHLVEFLAETAGLPPMKPQDIVLPYTGPDALQLDTPPIALHPGSSVETRRWPVASFAALIDELLHRGYPVLVLTGPSEAKLAQTLPRQLSVKPQPASFSILPKAPLLEVAARLKQCGCYIGHDTGPTHLAALLQIPTLALYAKSHRTPLSPLGPTVEMIQDMPLTQLPVQRVLDAALWLYNSRLR